MSGKYIGNLGVVLRCEDLHDALLKSTEGITCRVAVPAVQQHI